MQLIESLPLAALGELLSYAQKKEIERQTFPLWLANYAVAKAKGAENMPYTEFMAAINEAVDGSEASSSERSGEDILADFAPIIEAQRGG